MKVVCIDNVKGTYSLTIGKIYKVESETKHHYEIKNDKGELKLYWNERFDLIEGE